MRTLPAAIAAAAAVAALTLTGCGSDSSGPDSASTPPGATSSGAAPSGATPPGATSSGATAPAAASFTVTVADGKVSPKPAVRHVRLGDPVRLTVTSDKPDEVHVHGYDKEIEIEAGKPGTIDFTADIPGIFEVETHKSGLQLLQLEVK